MYLLTYEEGPNQKNTFSPDTKFILYSLELFEKLFAHRKNRVKNAEKWLNNIDVIERKKVNNSPNSIYTPKNVHATYCHIS